MHRSSILSFFALVASLLAIDCSREHYHFPDPLQPATAGAFVVREGTVTVNSREYAADFGTITVSENRENNTSGLIHLPVVRIRARASHPQEPIFGLAGGPGMSNLLCAPIDTLLAHRDFVLVGYRGVDGSRVLDCPEVSEELKEVGDPLSEGSLKSIGSAWARSFRRMEAQGIDLKGYTIPQTVEDMEEVRRALKYERIDLLSESYGTRVAYLYARMHPEVLCRSIMIGANPPGHFIWDPDTVDAQIRYYSQLWSQDSIMSGRCPDLAATMQRVLHSLPERWLFLSIDPGRVKVVVFALLFQRRTAAMVFDAIVAADRGDYSGLALMSLAFDYVVPSMFVWGDLALKAVNADYDSLSTDAVRSEAPGRILGSPLGTLLWGPLRYSNLPVTEHSREPGTEGPSGVETLILSGSVDFSTPPVFATKEFLPRLRNGNQIILAEYGHVGDIRSLRPALFTQLTASYFNSGVVDVSTIDYVPMDFQVDWGFPMLAKVGLGGVVMVFALLLAGLVWVVRKLI